MNNEPCRLCGSEPTVANYYDFYRFHCPTKGCREHLSQGVTVNGIGMWYGSIAEARDAWNKRQKRGEATSAPQTVEPEHEPAGADYDPQKGSKLLDMYAIRKKANDGCKMDAGRDDDGTCPNGIGQVSIDTREQLELDIRRWWDKEYPGSFYTPHDFMGLVVRWLNRQAAITHELDNVWAKAQQTRITELTEELKCYEGVDEAKEMWAKACQRERDKNAELTAERDELKAFANRLETAAHDKLGVTLFGVDYVTEEFMLHVRDTLTAERDRMQRVIDTQRESFRKMEADLKSAEDTANTLRASVAGLKDTLEKRDARIEMLEDENAALNMQVHGAPF